MSTAVLSYTLGLRHALDADHISVRLGIGTSNIASSRTDHR